MASIKLLGPGPRWGSLQCAPDILAAVSCYIYTLLAYNWVLEKFFWGPGKVLDFFVTMRVVMAVVYETDIVD